MSRFGGSERLRSTVIEDGFGGFRIVIPAARSWFLRLFLPFWLCAWAVGEVFVPTKLLSGEVRGEDILFLLLWLAFWTLGGVVAIWVLAWNWAGREVITLDGDEMLILRQVGPYVRSKSFEAAWVRNFRYSPDTEIPPSPDPNAIFRQTDLRVPTIAFDYRPKYRPEAKVHRFGEGLSEDEARRLILTIGRRLKLSDGPVVEPLPVQNG